MDPTAQVQPDATPTRRLPCLVVLVGSEPGRVVPLPRGDLVVGRSQSCGLVLDGQGVSRRHARVTTKPGRVEIGDLSSTNGLWVNGRQVTRHRLADGDCLQLGSARLAFRLSLPEEDRVLKQLYHRATRDVLTGLYNRASLDERLDREVAHHNRYRRGLALVMLDLDHFKHINDNLGHPAGDELLATTAATIAGCLRASDLAARAGGEEFVLVLPEADQARARRIADKVRLRVAAQGIKVGRRTVQVTASCGVAVAGADKITAAGLLKRADQACYRAKQAGRNRVAVAVTCASSGRPKRATSDASLPPMGIDKPASDA